MLACFVSSSSSHHSILSFALLCVCLFIFWFRRVCFCPVCLLACRLAMHTRCALQVLGYNSRCIWNDWARKSQRDTKRKRTKCFIGSVDKLRYVELHSVSPNQTMLWSSQRLTIQNYQIHLLHSDDAQQLCIPRKIDRKWNVLASNLFHSMKMRLYVVSCIWIRCILFFGHLLWKFNFSNFRHDFIS